MSHFKIKNIPIYVRTLIGIFKYAKNPLCILFYYLIRRTPKVMQSRSGIKIKPSDNPHDIITFVVIFCRKDYGDIEPDSVVVDVGANIGLFALYALSHGARHVICFEPCSDSFGWLTENIHLNGFDQNVHLVNKAVSDVGGHFVSIPVKSSPYNQITSTHDIHTDHTRIETVSLEAYLDPYPVIDLIKMDCEGAEFRILPALPRAFLDRVQEIRLELHISDGADAHTSLQACFPYQPFDIKKKDGQTFWLYRSV